MFRAWLCFARRLCYARCYVLRKRKKKEKRRGRTTRKEEEIRQNHMKQNKVKLRFGRWRYLQQKKLIQDSMTDHWACSRSTSLVDECKKIFKCQDIRQAHGVTVCLGMLRRLDLDKNRINITRNQYTTGTTVEDADQNPRLEQNNPLGWGCETHDSPYPDMSLTTCASCLDIEVLEDKKQNRRKTESQKLTVNLTVNLTAWIKPLPLP